MEQRVENAYAHVDQPAFEQMQIDQNISRVALFFVCFLTIAVFYFTLVSFPITKLLPFQQLQQVGQTVNSLNPTASRAPAVSVKPSGALGGSQITASTPPSPIVSAVPAAVEAAPASAAPAAQVSARPSASVSAAPLASGAYTVQSGDTLLAIARKYNTTVQAIADANKMTSNATLRVGQQIAIPKS
jgi:LysM repeat protein